MAREFRIKTDTRGVGLYSRKTIIYDKKGTPILILFPSVPSIVVNQDTEYNVRKESQEYFGVEST